MPWVAAIFNVFENYLGAHLRDFQYYKGRKCMFRDSRELLQCCMWTSDAVREVGMAQFKCKPSSNLRQDFQNHFMSLWSETRKRRKSIASFQPQWVSPRLVKPHTRKLNASYKSIVFNCDPPPPFFFDKVYIHTREWKDDIHFYWNCIIIKQHKGIAVIERVGKFWRDIVFTNVFHRVLQYLYQ